MPKKGNIIYLRKEGRWEGRYPKDKANGKTRYGYIFGKTFEEVESKINEITAYSSKLSTASGTSFESLSMEWLIAQKPQLITDGRTTCPATTEGLIVSPIYIAFFTGSLNF